MITSCINAFFAALAFGIIFNIRGKSLFFAALGGAISWLVYSVCHKLGVGEHYCLLFSSIAFSSYSELMARLLKTPVTIYIICALIPLVPGGGMYYTITEVVLSNYQQAVETGVNTIASAGALAMGILIVSSVINISNRLKIKYSRKKEEASIYQ